MEAITYQQLKTNLSMIQEIRSFYLKQEVNEHITCSLIGVVGETYKDTYVQENNALNEIEIFAEGEKPVSLFKGLMEEIQITLNGGMYEVNLKGISASFLTDMKKRSRSFQDKNMTYKDLLKTVIKDYSGGDIMDAATKGAALEQLILQYQETDWMFLKRMASHFNMGVIAAGQFATPKIYFGSFEGPEKGELTAYEYSIHKNIIDYKKASENTNPQLKELDAIEFVVETLENYELGDRVTFQKKSLMVKKKEIELRKGILWFRYILSSKNGMGKERIYADQITGVSLLGTVLEVVKDKIKVHLRLDQEQDVGKAWEFPYSTLYTAEGQSGWYCMPEKEDTVVIYFPTREEEMAVGMASLRIGLKGGDKIGDPSTKYFRTASGKEIKFSPDEVLITCINGENKETGEKQIVYIKLNQSSGVEITSTKPISFISEKGIKLEAEETIEITAKEQIKLHCKQSEIRMDTMVDICGPDVKIN